MNQIDEAQAGENVTVPNHRELIGRLRAGLLNWQRRDTVPAGTVDALLSDAITALSAQDTVRNDALEEAAVYFENEQSGHAQNRVGDYILDGIEIAAATRNLKTKSPAAEKECEHDWKLWSNFPVHEWKCQKCGEETSKDPSPQKPEPSPILEYTAWLSGKSHSKDGPSWADFHALAHELEHRRLNDRRLKPEAR